MGALLPHDLNAEVRKTVRSLSNVIDGLPRFDDKMTARAFLRHKPATTRQIRKFADKSVKTEIYAERIFVNWVQLLKRTEQTVYTLLEDVIARPYLKSSVAVKAVKCFAFQFSDRSYEVRSGSPKRLKQALRNKYFSFLRINTTC